MGVRPLPLQSRLTSRMHFYLGLAEPSTVPALDASCIAHTFSMHSERCRSSYTFSCCWSVTSDLSDIFTDSVIDIGTASVSFTPGSRRACIFYLGLAELCTALAFHASRLRVNAYLRP